MKPTPVTRLFAKRDVEPEIEQPRRIAPSPFIARAKELNAASIPRPAAQGRPVFAREAAPPEKKADAPIRPVFVRSQERIPAASLPAAAPAARQPDISAQLEQAYERGKQDGRASERLENEQAAAATLVAQRERAILERVEFQLNEYAKFGATIASAFEELEQRLAASVARILAIVVEEGVADAALSELKATLNHLIAGGASSLIRIRGPERLLGKLRDELENYSVDFEYVLEDRLDVCVEADDTHIETQLRNWGEMLHATLNG